MHYHERKIVTFEHHGKDLSQMAYEVLGQKPTIPTTLIGAQDAKVLYQPPLKSNKWLRNQWFFGTFNELWFKMKASTLSNIYGTMGVTTYIFWSWNAMQGIQIKHHHLKCISVNARHNKFSLEIFETWIWLWEPKLDFYMLPYTISYWILVYP